jgi:hemin uptake protein HemP
MRRPYRAHLLDTTDRIAPKKNTRVTATNSESTRTRTIRTPGSEFARRARSRRSGPPRRFGEGDVVYYDKGLDVLVAPASSRGTDDLTAAEKEVELSAKRPPEGLFEPHAKVLVEHEGEELLVPEGELGGHLGHGDEILDPTGRAAGAQGDRD